jgi:hypothetical protein
LAAVILAAAFFWMRTGAAQSTKSQNAAGREAASRAVSLRLLRGVKNQTLSLGELLKMLKAEPVPA